MKSKTIIITGPTATGKTGLSVGLSRIFDGEIISADSRQVYRGLDIGTGKDLEDYLSPTPVPYHLIDVVEPMEEFSLYHWRSQFIDSFNDIVDREKLPVVCGGTPLYLDMLIRDYELQGQGRAYSEDDYKELSLVALGAKLKKEHPEIHAKTDVSQRNRILRAFEIALSDQTPAQDLPAMNFLILAPYWHRKVVHQRIEQRLKERWIGMVEETKGLLANGVTHEKLDWFGLEYRFMSRLLKDELSEQEAFEQLLIKIRQFAKRQDVWFRKMEKAGAVIHWLTADNKLGQASDLVKLFLANKTLPEPDVRISEIAYGPKTQ